MKKAWFYLTNGVSVALEITTEPKHYDQIETEVALNQLGRMLGGSFSYVEETEETK